MCARRKNPLLFSVFPFFLLICLQTKFELSNNKTCGVQVQTNRALLVLVLVCHTGEISLMQSVFLSSNKAAEQMLYLWTLRMHCIL